MTGLPYVLIFFAAIECPPPPDIANATYTHYSGLWVTDVFFFECDIGYIVDGMVVPSRGFIIICMLEPDLVSADWSDGEKCTGRSSGK